MQDFRKLKVWQRAHALALESYRITRSFPREEIFGLTAQIRRAAASIPANIAEGCGRAGDREFGRFLGISLGSANELEYHFLLARDLALLREGDHDRLRDAVGEVRRMVSGLLQKLSGGR